MSQQAGNDIPEDLTEKTGGSDKIPLFVERQTYRRRRLVDAARALPVLGILLWLLPLLWAVPETSTRASTGLIYVFAVWLGLPVIAGVLIHAMNRRAQPPHPEDET
ncbi:hypothetical protein [uncultured Pelagimonas sp.]|uniref:hypothetical protein n=1 Tax=uncultured Pelagimonas sp. TaxID=1618102 RepID=UPI0026247E51|nr:hypothetical protein [uncultured Pelagimonas sp.]